MNSIRFLVVVSALVFLSVCTAALCAQDMPESAAPADTAAAAANDTQWVWAEVISLDNQNKTLTLKYLDYDSDQEKEIVVSVDDKTKFENVSSFDELKVKDNLSVDYSNVDGKNVARNISLEKLDNLDLPAAGATDSIEPPAAPQPAAAQKESAAAVSEATGGNVSLAPPGAAEAMPPGQPETKKQ